MFWFVNPILTKINIWLQRQLAYNNAYKELNSLSDKELSDIGINRYDIHNTVFDTLKQRVPSQSF